jgi:hypothetical protein
VHRKVKAERQHCQRSERFVGAVRSEGRAPEIVAPQLTQWRVWPQVQIVPDRGKVVERKAVAQVRSVAQRCSERHRHQPRAAAEATAALSLLAFGDPLLAQWISGWRLRSAAATALAPAAHAWVLGGRLPPQRRRNPMVPLPARLKLSYSTRAAPAGPPAGYSSHQKIEDLNCSLNLTCQFDLLKMLLAESESRYYQDTFIWIEFFS